MALSPKSGNLATLVNIRRVYYTHVRGLCTMMPLQFFPVVLYWVCRWVTSQAKKTESRGKKNARLLNKVT